MVAVNRDALLTGDERKAFAEFEQKFLQMVEQGLFDVRFGQMRRVFKIQNPARTGL